MQSSQEKTMKVSRRNFALTLAGAPVHSARPARRPEGARQDRHRARHRRHRPDALRQFHRAPGPLHRRRHLRREVAALRRQRLPQGRAGSGAQAERDAAALAGRQLLVELQLARRHRSARPAPAAPGDGLGHGREQSLRHPRVPGLRRAAGDAALHLRQPRHRHLDRGAAVGGVLQLLRRHRDDAPAQPERPPRPLEGEVLGTRQRDGRPVADGPSQRRGLRQVRAGSRQADEVDRPQRQADRRGLVQLRPRLRLDGVEPHRARIPAHACRLSVAAYLRRQSRQRLRRFHGEFDRTRSAHQDRRGHHRRRALRAAGQSQDLHRVGRVECLVSRARQHAARPPHSGRDSTTWKTRW